MIRTENIHKRFKRLQALNNINAEFKKGQVVSLIGPNGSGKTTLIKIILGIVKQDSGKIYFDNHIIDKDVDYRSHIGYMPQIGRYPDNMKIGQVIEMIKNIRNRKDNLDEELFRAYRMDTMLDKSMRSLSGGTRQKVSAILAFLFDPEVLILDEPTAGLDPLASEILKEKIISEKEKGKLILITSHILSDLDEITTDVMYLQDGRVQLYEPIEKLKEQTGEERLEKAIAQIMKNSSKEEGKYPIIKRLNVKYA